MLYGTKSQLLASTFENESSETTPCKSYKPHINKVILGQSLSEKEEVVPL